MRERDTSKRERMVERERELDYHRTQIHVHAVTCFDLAVSDWVSNYFLTVSDWVSNFLSVLSICGQSRSQLRYASSTGPLYEIFNGGKFSAGLGRSIITFEGI